MIYNSIRNFNIISDSIFYKNFFIIFSIIYFILSYLSELYTEKFCSNIFANLLSIFHHFIMFFVYFSFLAPFSILNILIFINIVTLILWIIYNNKCILTLLENKLCNRKKSHRFQDLTYFISRDFDKYLIRFRIPLLIFLLIFNLIRYYISNNKIEIQAHRGGRGYFPENTLSAFSYVMKNNINILELDIQLTKDNEIVIYHDKNINNIICDGESYPIKELTLEQIKKYDCGSKINPEYKTQTIKNGEKIPTLRELFNLVENDYKYNNIKFNIEIKTNEKEDNNEEVIKFTKILINLINNYNLKNNVIIQSFDIRVLKAIKNIDNSFITSYLIEDKVIDDNIIGIIKDLNINIISPDYKLLNKNIVEKIKKNNISIIAWTINNKEILNKMIFYNINGIITDYPIEIKQLLYNY